MRAGGDGQHFPIADLMGKTKKRDDGHRVRGGGDDGNHAENPRDASFQLTFLSVVGIALITPRLQTWSKNIIKDKIVVNEGFS